MHQTIAGLTGIPKGNVLIGGKGILPDLANGLERALLSASPAAVLVISAANLVLAPGERGTWVRSIHHA